MQAINARRRRGAWLAYLGGLLLCACDDGGPSTNAIDRLIMALGDPSALVELDVLLPCGTTCPEPDEFCTWHERTYQHGSETYPMLAPHADVVYPGADLQGRSLYDGIPAPITAPRGGGDIVLASNPNGSNSTSCHLEEVSLADVTECINSIVGGQPERFPADLTLTMQRTRCQEELQVDLQASASFFDIFEASSGFHVVEDERYSAFAFKLYQNFYSIAFERPPNPHEFYAPTVTVSDLDQQIGEGNPAAYVSQVTYGRVFYLLIQATENEADMEATLRANFIGFAEGDGRFKHFSEFSNLNIQAYAYGGDQEEVLEAIQTIGKWRDFWDNLKDSNDLLAAKALSYTVRSIATGRVLKSAVSADYEYSSCVFPDDCPLVLFSPLLGARLDNGCIVDPNPIEWTFDWTDCPHAEAYHIQVLQGNRLIIDNDQVTASRFVHRASTPFIHMEKD